MAEPIVDNDLDRTVDAVLEGLVTAWNAGDADRYAAHFRPDADFVDVLGRHLHGADAIADIHRRNFATIHLGSRLAIRRLRVVPLRGEFGLAVTASTIEVPAGPLAGNSAATQTMLLQRTDDVWRIRAFHNTFVRDMPGAPTVRD